MRNEDNGNSPRKSAGNNVGEDKRIFNSLSSIQEFMGGKLEKMASSTLEVTEVKIDICLKRTLNLASDILRGHRVS